MPEPLRQVLLAAGYYFGLLLLTRLAGKRLAGQATTFDLIVLITLAVVLQQTTLRPGNVNAFVFLITVFALHRGVAMLCLRSPWLRRLVRGRARPLVENGRIMHRALEAESMSEAELLAGLRKVGHDDPTKVRLACLEETGHISVVPM